jgi:tetratricopeptide (TPR) repeat protein
MVLKLNLNKVGGRVALAVLVLAGSSVLVVVIISRFVIGTLAEGRLLVTRDMLQAPVAYFPNSARLNARLASAELSESNRDLSSAKAHAQRAVALSPFDHRIRITLASVEEAAGDRSAAEATLEAARTLAPNYWSVNYRLGNLLVRQGKLAESLEPFRIAVAANSTLLPGTLDLLWRASREDVNALQTVAGTAPSARMTLAQFLLKASRPAEAAAVFGSISRADRITLARDSSTFLNSLIAAGGLGPARELWGEMAAGDRQAALVGNGGFESDILKDFAQFDWSVGRSEYARFAIDTAVAHSGSRSLRIEFVGRDTTQLDNEIKHLVLVRPGGRYLLECFAKPGELETPEGPRVVITGATSPVWIAASEPVARGSGDWQRLSVEFVAPQSPNGGLSAVFVSIKRKPKFSYDEPTSGTVWLDDFLLKEQ